MPQTRTSRDRDRTCLLLVNPAARSGQAGAARAADLLKRERLIVDEPSIDSPDAMRAAIAASKHDIIVVGGGDGTIATVAQSLLDAKRTVGLLPLGTANDLARSLGIPANLDDAVAVIAHGVARPIDMGVVNGRLYFNAVTLGLGPQVRRTHEATDKQLLGVFNYPRAIIQTMLDREYFQAEITCDGKRASARLLHIGVVNGRYHGGGLPAHEDATIDDGLLHLYAVRAATPLRYLRLLPSLMLGRDDNPDILRIAGASIRIETKKPMPATADGEEVESTPLDLSCRPGALTMMVPADSAVLDVSGPDQIAAA
ncbi:MAG: YegS/Rv2252/BmrU family lipid kinase [Geminicoccaceae bacterium]|nr:YegS/Rv2252/BmrU family lipid kinase [Geminicoccaceae bacterium]MCB9945696.1 YegS/Rv2252/BmrU family lipid kinase [Geminicoccaceae bacterium]